MRREVEMGDLVNFRDVTQSQRNLHIENPEERPLMACKRKDAATPEAGSRKQAASSRSRPKPSRKRQQGKGSRETGDPGGKSPLEGAVTPTRIRKE
ncbi:hypothetical protein B0T13DRAFT_514447 [Neurospora crassa]|nr:hypothetical protein B0T13DRAFT_514447 [Neurospora crassa]